MDNSPNMLDSSMEFINRRSPTSKKKVQSLEVQAISKRNAEFAKANAKKSTEQILTKIGEKLAIEPKEVIFNDVEPG